jgi:hypothetical protein
MSSSFPARLTRRKRVLESPSSWIVGKRSSDCSTDFADSEDQRLSDCTCVSEITSTADTDGACSDDPDLCCDRCDIVEVKAYTKFMSISPDIFLMKLLSSRGYDSLPIPSSSIRAR